MIKHTKAKNYKWFNLSDLGFSDVLAEEQKDWNYLLMVVITQTKFDVVQPVHVSNEQMHSSTTKSWKSYQKWFYGIPHRYLGPVSPSLLWKGPPLVKEGVFSFGKATLKFSFTKLPLTFLTKGLPWNLRGE